MTAAWRLVESNPWSQRSRNPALALAVLAHLTVLLPLGIAQLLRVVPPPEEPFAVTPVLSVLLEPPPLEPVLEELPPYDVQVPRGTPTAPPLSREAGSEPLPDVPDTAPPPGVGDLDTGRIEDLAGFGERGQPGSGPGDGGDGPGIPGDRDGEDDSVAPLPVGGQVTAPTLLHKVNPGYPLTAMRARLSGRVIVQAVIARDGTVEDVEIAYSSSRVFEQAALDAVREWRYAPARLNGRPVRVSFRVNVEFILN